MSVTVGVNDLLDYTDWERSKWFELLRKHDGKPLETGAGPYGDGRFAKVGELIRHIFSAEKRYIERLSGQPLTDTSSVPANDLEAIVELGERSRQGLRQFIDTLSPEEWDAPRELKLMSSFLSASPRKIVVHILLHEIRHWAQIATLLRLNGVTDDFHDFLFSPAMGGELRRGSESS
jgi:uncharacterized damage-inducible protein DinB